MAVSGLAAGYGRLHVLLTSCNSYEIKLVFLIIFRIDYLLLIILAIDFFV